MKTKNALILILTSLIWGLAFVAQSKGGAALGPYTFNFIRFLIAGIVLIPIVKFINMKKTKDGIYNQVSSNPKEKKILLLGGICCGLVLGLASNLQQLGINAGAAAGKAGFLTACYIVLVPVLGIFMKKKCGMNVWLAVFITVVGLYYLCIDGQFSIKKEDLLLIACAFVFSVHILVIDYFSPKVDGVCMSCIQFWVAALFSVFPMLINEFQNGPEAWLMLFTDGKVWIPILYAAVMSSGVGYTLQIIGQQGVNPTIASLLLSLESVFSVLGGWVILHEKLSIRGLIGSSLIFIAIIIAQIDFKSLKNQTN